MAVSPAYDGQDTNQLESVVLMGGNVSDYTSVATAQPVPTTTEAESFIMGVPGDFAGIELASAPGNIVDSIHDRVETYYYAGTGFNVGNGQYTTYVSGNYSVTLAASSMTYSNGGVPSSISY